MNQTFQPGLHPDADQLAAFAEQALPLHEREQTLAHLAVCGDCRQIVFLAQAAVPEQVARIATATARRPWFSGWNLLWPAVAALAGIVGFSVYLGRVRITDRRPQTITTATASAPPPPAAAPQPIAHTVDRPAAKMPKAAMRGGIDTEAAAPPKPAQPPVVAALRPEDKPMPMAAPKLPAAPAPGVRDGAPSTLDGVANLPVQGRNQAVVAGIAGAAAAGQAAIHGTEQQSAQSRFQAYTAPAKPATASPPSQAAAAPMQQLSPPPPAPPAPAPAPSFAPSFAQRQTTQQSQLNQAGQANQTVTVVNAAPIQLDTATLAGTLSTLVPVLPNHLETISSTSNGPDLLAVDSGGSVFLSHDEGKHWKSVAAAWAGRPVKVELAAPATTEREADEQLKKTTASTSQDATAAAAATVMAGALAPRGGAQLHGVVTDPAGAAIPGAQVRVQAAGGTSVTTLRTDEAGRFQAAGMPQGTYELTIAAPGFSTLVRTVELDARTPMGFTAVLPIGAATETVTVEGARSVAQTKRVKSPGFQLTTDTGVVWVSSDGRNWKRR
jgi:hypothetical protein